MPWCKGKQVPATKDTPAYESDECEYEVMARFTDGDGNLRELKQCPLCGRVCID